jgi:DNA-binding CsgD family transcriptional regulator
MKIEISEDGNEYIIHIPRLAFWEPKGAPIVSNELTVRERQIFALVQEYKVNKEIAAELGISSRTAKFHVSNIFRKFGVHSRIELLDQAVRDRAMLAVTGRSRDTSRDVGPPRAGDSHEKDSLVRAGGSNAARSGGARARARS